MIGQPASNFMAGMLVVQQESGEAKFGDFKQRKLELGFIIKRGL